MRAPYPLNIMRHRMVFIAITGGLLMLGGAIWFHRSFQNNLIVENRSGQPVSLLMIGVYNSSSCAMFQKVPDGGKASAPFSAGSDGGFYVSGFLEDGTRIEGCYGYVTSNMFGEYARFVIKPGGNLDFSRGRN